MRTLSYCIVETDETAPTSSRFSFDITAWDSIDVQVDDDSATDTDTNLNTTSTSSGAPTGVGRPSKRAKAAVAVSVHDAAKMLMDTLHRRADVLAHGVDAIIIEQQPAGGHNAQSNVRMKVLSHAIQCYFYTRGLLSHVFVPPAILFVSAISKFVEMPKPKRVSASRAVVSAAVSAEVSVAAVKDVKKPRVVSAYVRNKKYAVAKTGELLTQQLPIDHPARRLLGSTSTKKKDDLADSFLLGYYFLKKRFDGRAHEEAKAAKVAAKAEATAAKAEAMAAAKAEATKPKARACARKLDMGGRKRKTAAETQEVVAEEAEPEKLAACEERGSGGTTPNESSHAPVSSRKKRQKTQTREPAAGGGEGEVVA